MEGRLGPSSLAALQLGEDLVHDGVAGFPTFAHIGHCAAEAVEFGLRCIDGRPNQANLRFGSGVLKTDSCD